MAKKFIELSKRLRAVYAEIDQDIVSVHAFWKLCIQLYGTAESVKLTNGAASTAFGLIESSLLDGVLSQISRLRAKKVSGTV